MRTESDSGEPRLVWANQGGETEEITFRELTEVMQVMALAFAELAEAMFEFASNTMGDLYGPSEEEWPAGTCWEENSDGLQDRGIQPLRGVLSASRFMERWEEGRVYRKVHSETTSNNGDNERR